MPERPRLLVVGGGFAGFVCARHMASTYDVTLIDAKEYFEYTPGILRAYVKPSHLNHLTFMYQPVFEKMGVKFLFGEVTNLDGDKRIATYKAMHSPTEEQVTFDYCIIGAGCNFGLFNKVGESLWFPTVWEYARKESGWGHIDERFWNGRLQHMEEEHAKIKAINDKKGSILVVGAGFIGVEWATEIHEFFPNIELTLCDMLPKCLGPLPDSAKDYCQDYLNKAGIKTKYGVKFNPNDSEGWKAVCESKPDSVYISTGFKASCKFIPKNVLSQYDPKEADEFQKDIKKRGPAGGGWIRVNKKLQVLYQGEDGEDRVWGADNKGFGRIYAVGDCNMIADLPPIPKISYPGEDQAALACRQIEKIEHIQSTGSEVGCYTWPKQWPCLPWYGKLELQDAWWPWGSGMFATSLGVKDACFVVAANHNPGSGYMVLKGRLSAIQKWYIEWSKVDQCKNGWIGLATWWGVH